MTSRALPPSRMKLCLRAALTPPLPGPGASSPPSISRDFSALSALWKWNHVVFVFCDCPQESSTLLCVSERPSPSRPTGAEAMLPSCRPSLSCASFPALMSFVFSSFFLRSDIETPSHFLLCTPCSSFLCGYRGLASDIRKLKHPDLDLGQLRFSGL